MNTICQPGFSLSNSIDTFEVGLPIEMERQDGCFEADTRLSVNVGADADFFNLFNADTQLQLYTQSFQIFKVMNFQLP